MTFDEWYSMQSHQLSNEQVCRVIWNAARKAAIEDCAILADKYAEQLRELSQRDRGTADDAAEDIGREIRAL
jgi:hypothetical protein